MNRLLFFCAIFCFAASSQLKGQTGAIRIRQLTTGGITQLFDYTASYQAAPCPIASTCPPFPFQLSDMQTNTTSNLPSGGGPQTVAQSLSLLPNWSLDSITCVCYTNLSTSCQSTWIADSSPTEMNVFITLGGQQETVDCTFVDTPSPCTGPSCSVQGEIDVHQISASGTSQSFTYQETTCPNQTICPPQITLPGSPFILTDGQVNSSGAIASYKPYSITQTNVPANWSVTNISCVCSPLAPNNAPCQSIWTPDLLHSTVNIILHGAEKVVCTFVDTQNACTSPTCASCGNGVVEGNEQCDNGIHNSDSVFGPGQCTTQCTIAPLTPPQGEIDITQITTSSTSQLFTYQTTYSSSPITLANGQTNSSAPITSFTNYSITQTVPINWSVTNISCVCSPLPIPGILSALCQSTWVIDVPNSNVNISLQGAEKVVCTFTDTLNAPTPSPCAVKAIGFKKSSKMFGLFDSCNQLPGRTSQVSVILMILAALFWVTRFSVKLRR